MANRHNDFTEVARRQSQIAREKGEEPFLDILERIVTALVWILGAGGVAVAIFAALKFILAFV